MPTEPLKSLDDQTLRRLKVLIEEEAKSLAETAALGGEYGDRGATVLREQLRFYELGRQQVAPPEWQKFFIQLDPDYPQYLRLKKKFEGK